MFPIHQTNLTPQAGNCLAAALASILEIPISHVPDFNQHKDAQEQTEAMNRWLICKYDLYAIDVKPQSIEHHIGRVGYHLINGQSIRHPEVDHAIVGYNGKPVHDPYPQGNCQLNQPIYYTIFLKRFAKPPEM